MLVIISNKKGFVLIETIIVMSVLLIGMIILYSNYNKMIINSSKVNYYDNVDDMYTAYYAYKYVNDLATWNSDNDYKVIKIDDSLGENFKKIFSNLNIETIYYFSKKGFENIFSEKDGNCEDKPNQLLCYDGTTINYLRSIENKNDTSKCDDSNQVPCITIVKINRDDHYYFAKYEAYDNNKIKPDNDVPTELEPYYFDYTGKNQIFNVPYTGEYKLEVWGAQGGYAKSEIEYPGGYGAYSVGTLQLHKGDYLFIVVGGQGTKSTSKMVAAFAGGYNGGGTGYGSKSYYVSGGGGATHIAKRSGIINSFENDLNNLLIVAAGGGGGAFQDSKNYGKGGSGGGLIGVSATTTVKGIISDVPASVGGKQDSLGSTGDYYGSFGLGASCNQVKKICSGGGGGYYGGGAGNNAAGGSGGSGYIGNADLTNKSMYCYNCTESLEEPTKTISTTCLNETATENCAKEGNGYVRITYQNNKQ